LRIKIINEKGEVVEVEISKEAIKSCAKTAKALYGGNWEKFAECLAEEIADEMTWRWRKSWMGYAIYRSLIEKTGDEKEARKRWAEIVRNYKNKMRELAKKWITEFFLEYMIRLLEEAEKK
jgi:hypothetical protein